MNLPGIFSTHPLSLLIFLLIGSSIFLLFYYIFKSFKRREPYPRYLAFLILLMGTLGVFAYYQTSYPKPNNPFPKDNPTSPPDKIIDTSAVLGDQTTTCPDNSACTLSPAEWLQDASQYLNGDLIIHSNGKVRLSPDSVTANNIAFRTINNNGLATGSVTSRIIKNHTIRSIDLYKHLTIKRLTVDDKLIADNADIGTLDLGTNTLSDGTLTGDWNLGSGNLTTTGTITGTFAGAFAPSGDVDMQNHILTNIGNSGTDFTSSGGLTLADNLDLGANTITTTNTNLVANLNANYLEGHNASYFQTALTNPVTGTGTANYLSKFTDTSALGNSLVYDDGTNVGIGTTNPGAKLEINNTSVPTGPNLISNGTFDHNADGWNLYDSGTYNAGSQDVTVNYTGAEDMPDASTDITVESGKTYLLTFTLSNVSGDSVSVYFDKNSWYSSHSGYLFGNGTHTVAFTADSSDPDTINFENYNWNAGSTWTIDDVSLKETSPISPALKVIGYDGSVWLSLGGDLLGNTALGQGALASNTTGSANSAQGASALYSNTTGYSNSAQGAFALSSNTTGYFNSAQGAFALYSNTTGYFNSAQGAFALYSNTTGSWNSAQGASALFGNTTGSNNVAVGRGAGFAGMGEYNNNTLIGYQVGYNTSTPGYSNNTAIGFQAGYNLTGNNNVMLGNYAGAYELGSNSFYVDNQDRTNTAGDKSGALLYGTFNANPLLQTLTINGNLGIGTTNPTTKLYVNSTADENVATIADSDGTCTLNPESGGGWSCSSDARLKKDITTMGMDESLNKVLALNPVSFTMKVNNSQSFGFIAQEVQNIIPEAVSTLPDGYLGLDESRFTPYIVGAIQSQQTQIAGISSSQSLISNQIQTSNDQITNLQTQLNDQALSIGDKLNLVGTNLAQQSGILNQVSNEIGNKTALLPEDQAKLDALGNDIYGMMAALANQMDTIKEENKAMMDFYTAFELGNVLLKDAQGNVDLLNGKLEASGVVAGAFTVKVVDPEARTIGTNIIKAGDTEIEVDTTAITANSKIFITAKNKKALGFPLTVTETKNGAYFKVDIPQTLPDDLDFDWWIVEEK